MPAKSSEMSGDRFGYARIVRSETRLEGLLSAVEQASRRGDAWAAVRFADAAARLAPTNPDIRQILGRALARAGRFQEAALQFATALETRRDPDLHAELAVALRCAGDVKAAQARLATALRTFAVEPGDPLATAARSLVCDPRSDARGWVGFSLEGRVWGEAAGAARSSLRGLDVALEPASPAPEPPADADLAAFTLTSAQLLTTRSLFDANAVIGWPAAYVTDQDLDGRAWCEGGVLKGWVSCGRSPRRDLKVLVSDGQGREQELAAARDPHAPFRQTFELDLADWPAAAFHVQVAQPDGGRWLLPDSPALVEPPPPPPAPLARPPLVRRLLRGRRRGVDVVVPVHSGLDETLACLRSIRETVGRSVGIIVVDDCSPDPALRTALRRIALKRGFTLLRNATNLGFPASVNRGFQVRPHRDVVIVNADAQVFPGWLETLRAVAYKAPLTGTVTALTNSGSIASYPADEADCSEDRARELAERAAAEFGDQAVSCPSGVGFCMYIRRDCLDEVGGFDDRLFDKGYGEENDFCLRAAQAGWRHVIAPGVFVRHIGGRSFGKRRQALMDRNRRLLNARYPGYDEAVQAYLAGDPLRPVRRRLDEIGLKRVAAPFRLLVTTDLPGGVERFVSQRAQELWNAGESVLVLKPLGPGRGVRLSCPEAPHLGHLEYGPGEEQQLLALLARLALTGIELHHFLHVDARLMQALLSCGTPYDVYVHDYAWICPRITLVGPDGGYCGEPRLRSCEACGRKPGRQLEAGLGVADLRNRSAGWLAGAREVIVPSRDVAQRLQRYFPDLRPQIRPWDEARPAPTPPAPRDRGALKVAVIGAIGDHKGYSILHACAEDAARRDLPLEFVVIGFSQDDEGLLATGRVFVTGEYAEDELCELLAREAPDAAFFPTVAPETWCFGLSHAFRAGLPVLALDRGAVAERLRERGEAFELLAPDAAAAEINDALVGLTAPKPVTAVAPDLLHSPTPAPRASSETTLAPAPAPPAPAPTVQRPDPIGSPMSDTTGLIVSVEVLSLSKGLYHFAVQSAQPRRLGEDGEIVLPAVQVGLAPGAPPDQVEIMTGVKTEGAWLFEARDSLVMKVKTTPAMVLLTSLRAEGMAPLEISVERLDGKKTAAIAPPPAPAPTLEAPKGWARAAAISDARPKSAVQGEARTEILAHVTMKGDVAYRDTFWAGAVGENLPIEGFSIQPTERLDDAQIEYKAVTATGVETPWVAGGEFCGTRGMGMPLAGFAVRLSGGAEERYDCEYRGSFRSGRVVGPITNGAPCRALAADDYLEAIQLTIVERRSPLKLNQIEPPAEAPAPAPVLEAADAAPSPARVGPRFSIFREDAS